ncbi:hypothetical protein SCUCBS95973_006607 [Sporothrix curviconia]|uniref:Uncharacterized protein n=1 Tax=Sporothrix curviconia TaxID=1260050 RepID=A0ABP0C916_9PEZI
MSTSQPLQVAQPTFINLPQPPSNPDTPSETPGTPTSTTTSLSAVSTTAIKDGHRGGHVPPLLLSGGATGTSSQQRFGHQHNASTNSLEAERADRISRLTGLSGMTTLRPSYAANRGSVTSGGGGGGGTSNRFGPGSISSPQATPASSGSGGAFMSSGMPVPGPLTPAFFDAQGQPVAITKMSTVGTASATNSISGRTLGDGDTVDGSTMTEDDDIDDDDIRSMGTNYHYSGSTGHGVGGGMEGRDVDAMMMDDDNLDTASRSVGGYEYDRMSDDGSASLVGFGEGAGSTVSGPIYHRRPLPPTTSSAGAIAANNAMAWATTLERTNSGLSDVAVMGSVSGASTTGGTPAGTAPMAAMPQLGATFGNSSGGNNTRRDFVRSPLEHFRDASGGGSSTNSSGGGGSGGGGSGGGGGGGDGSLAGLHERRDMRLIDGMAMDDRLAGRGGHMAHMTGDDDVFVDTTGRGPVPLGDNGSSSASPLPPLMAPIIQAHPSALRETQRPRSHQQQQQNQYHYYNTSNSSNTHGHNHSASGSGMSREHDAAEQLLQSAHGAQGAAPGFEGPYDGPAATGASSTRYSDRGGHLGGFDFEERK